MGGEANAIGFIGDVLLEDREVVLAGGVLDVSEEFGSLAHEVHPPPQQIMGGAHARRIDIGHDEQIMRRDGMAVLVAGASGATGRLLVEQLLDRGMSVRIIVRPRRDLPENFTNRENLATIRAAILELSDAEMAQHVRGCAAVASCLGHNLSLRGIYGQPRRLVTDATRRLCNAIKSNKPETPVKFILMNTAGNSNRDLHEPISFGERCVIGLFRLLLPPHIDNEEAADYLRTRIGQQDKTIEWAAVRPDSLIHEDEVSAYEVHPSPTRSAIFNAGLTSRINVAHFMARLITEDSIWNQWKGQMPVIYSKVLS